MLEGLKAPAHGNAEVVALFEEYLEKARLGKINYGGAITAEQPDIISYDSAGSIEMVPLAETALDLLKQRIVNAHINRLPPEPDPELGADYVCYNLAAAAVGFDFCPWLVDAEMERRREGAPAPL